eukprot:scaffold10_cov257-Pinguiococcus_pyrenoidosus.AAC.57
MKDDRLSDRVRVSLPRSALKMLTALLQAQRPSERDEAVVPALEVAQQVQLLAGEEGAILERQILLQHDVAPHVVVVRHVSVEAVAVLVEHGTLNVADEASAFQRRLGHARLVAELRERVDDDTREDVEQQERHQHEVADVEDVSAHGVRRQVVLRSGHDIRHARVDAQAIVEDGHDAAKERLAAGVALVVHLEIVGEQRKGDAAVDEHDDHRQQRRLQQRLPIQQDGPEDAVQGSFPKGHVQKSEGEDGVARLAPLRARETGHIASDADEEVEEVVVAAAGDQEEAKHACLEALPGGDAGREVVRQLDLPQQPLQEARADLAEERRMLPLPRAALIGPHGALHSLIFLRLRRRPGLARGQSHAAHVVLEHVHRLHAAIVRQRQQSQRAEAQVDDAANDGYRVQQLVGRRVLAGIPAVSEVQQDDQQRHEEGRVHELQLVVRQEADPGALQAIHVLHLIEELAPQQHEALDLLGMVLEVAAQQELDALAGLAHARLRIGRDADRGLEEVDPLDVAVSHKLDARVHGLPAPHERMKLADDLRRSFQRVGISIVLVGARARGPPIGVGVPVALEPVGSNCVQQQAQHLVHRADSLNPLALDCDSLVVRRFVLGVHIQRCARRDNVVGHVHNALDGLHVERLGRVDVAQPRPEGLPAQATPVNVGGDGVHVGVAENGVEDVHLLAAFQHGVKQENHLRLERRRQHLGFFVQRSHKAVLPAAGVIRLRQDVADAPQQGRPRETGRVSRVPLRHLPQALDDLVGDVDGVLINVPELRVGIEIKDPLDLLEVAHELAHDVEGAHVVTLHSQVVLQRPVMILAQKAKEVQHVDDEELAVQRGRRRRRTIRALVAELDERLLPPPLDREERRGRGSVVLRQLRHARL